MRSLILGLAILLLTGCPEKVLTIDEVGLCDRSSSSGTCTEDSVRREADAFLEANPSPGSRFTVLIVGCGIEDVARQYEIRVPDRWGRGAVKKKRGWQEEERRRLATLVLPAVNQCSDVSAGLWRAARLLAERTNSIRQLVVISDLREVSHSLGINFERKVSAPADFVAKLRAAQLLADLSGVQMRVCGVHDRATPDAPTWTARKAQQLHLAWTAALAAMGNPDVRMTESCDFRNARNSSALAQGGR